MWLKNFCNELKAWHIVRKVYKHNKKDFELVNLKCGWTGKMFRVINRDPEVALGSEEDEAYLHKELAEMWGIIWKHNIADILAYELIPLESENRINEKEVEYEHGYLVMFTPAWNLDKQYVTWKSVTMMSLLGLGLVGGIVYAILNYFIL